VQKIENSNKDIGDTHKIQIPVVHYLTGIPGDDKNSESYNDGK